LSITLDLVGHEFVQGRPLFRELTADLVPGHSYALVGPSGVGKSTLLSIISGTIAPSFGEVDLTSVHRTGWVFQNPHGVPSRSTLDHATLPFLARGMERAPAAAEALELLEQFKLADAAETLYRGLSGGEAQRLMLVRALAAEPDLLLVDEPTAQLDHRTAETVNSVLQNVAGRGTIVVIATHDAGTRDSCTDSIDLLDFQ